MSQYRCKQYDVLDYICKKYYGNEKDYTEMVYAANPGLADRGSHLPMGLLIELPDVTFQSENNEINLWD